MSQFSYHFLHFAGPRIIAEQETSGDQLLVKNHSVKVRRSGEDEACIDRMTRNVLTQSELFALDIRNGFDEWRHLTRSLVLTHLLGGRKEHLYNQCSVCASVCARVCSLTCSMVGYLVVVTLCCG